MRISNNEISNLKSSIYSFDKNAQIYLFGSRADDTKKGGDIDLLIVSKVITKKDLRRVRVNFFTEFEEQKIDIVLDDGTLKDPFVKLILGGAVKL